MIDYTHTKVENHKFSRFIERLLTILPSTVIEEGTSDEYFAPELKVEEVSTLRFDPIYQLTGYPVFEARVEHGDVLKITLNKIEMINWDGMTIA